jgi:hypothetical protein
LRDLLQHPFAPAHRADALCRRTRTARAAWDSARRWRPARRRLARFAGREADGEGRRPVIQAWSRTIKSVKPGF